MNKKLGPLPLWGWLVVVVGVAGVIYLRSRSSSSNSANTVDPNSPMGLTYGQEAADQSQGIDPLTGETYAQEQAAQAAAAPASSGGGGDSGSAAAPAPVDLSPVTDALGTISGQIGQVDSDVLSTSAQGPPDQGTPSPVQTFAGEIGDVGTGVAGLRALSALFAPVPVTAAASTPAGKATKLSGGKAPEAGAIPAKFGSNKPAAKSGFTIVGTGKGNWWYVPSKTVKKTVTPKPKPPAAAKSTGGKKTVVSGKKGKR